MITIFSNWNGQALVSGSTLDEARAKLDHADCAADTTFGSDVLQMTALDTGVKSVSDVGDVPLYAARARFKAVETSGLCRVS